MVKRQKEKLYQSAREHRANAQIRSGSSASAGTSTVQRRLPFSHCALSLNPYEHPVCNWKNGIVFESSAITPFVLQHKTDPVSGEPLQSKDLIQLNMSKDEEGRWQCPVLTKPFSDHTKIVAILQPNRTEANVFSWEAYYELNVKANNYEDLLSGAPFHKKKDVLTLFDPNDDEFNSRRDINQFYHVQHARKLNNEGNNSNPQGSSSIQSDNVRHSVTSSRILEKLQKKKESSAAAQQAMTAAAAEKKNKKRKAEAEDDSSNTTDTSVTHYFDSKTGQRLKILAQDVTGVSYTQGSATASLTSTAVPTAVDNRDREATDKEILEAQLRVMRRLKKPGYVRLRIAAGESSSSSSVVTVELHCDRVPRTCANFLGLCAAGQYDNSTFHRLIPGFMIQGGKPPAGSDGDTKEEECLWGGTFANEFDDRLTHKGHVLSMANAGPNTNKRQFFLTFKSAPHLDRKHSVFGTVVEGQDCLKKLERIPTDAKERPKKEIRIVGTDVLVDPYAEARELEQKRLEQLVAQREGPKAATGAVKTAAAAQTKMEKQSGQVGRYLKRPKQQQGDDEESSRRAADDAVLPARLPPPPKKTTFGNFSGW